MMFFFSNVSPASKYGGHFGYPGGATGVQTLVISGHRETGKASALAVPGSGSKGKGEKRESFFLVG